MAPLKKFQTPSPRSIAKAEKAVQIATALLGPEAGTQMIEDQACDLMRLSTRQLSSTLIRLEHRKFYRPKKVA